MPSLARVRLGCMLLGILLGLPAAVRAQAQFGAPVPLAPEADEAAGKQVAEPKAPSAAAPKLIDGFDENVVRRLVAERLQEEAKKKKAQEDAKKQEDEKKKADEKAQGVVVGSVTNASINWRNGFWMETANKDFQMHLGGNVQYDLTTFAPQSNLTTGPRTIGPVEDAAYLRRARLRTEGTMWEVCDFRFEMEFATTSVTPPGSDVGITRRSQQQTFLTPTPTDTWFSVKELPIVGTMRVGRQKEQFSLENIDSDRFLPFMERSPLYDFFTPTAYNNGRNPGIVFMNNILDDKVRWAMGVYKNAYNPYGFGVGGGEFAATGRLTTLPYFEQEGRYLLHLGISGSHRDPVLEEDRFRARPSLRNVSSFTPVLVDTGFFNMTSQDLIGLEFFLNLGSLTFQAEYQGSWNQDSALPGKAVMGTTYFQGYYVQALYWLTGEYTRWDKREARPDRYIPNAPFYLMSGPAGLLEHPGAWQLCLRYSYLDGNSLGIKGGLLDDITAGVNWALNPNCRIQWNYIWERRYGLGNANNGNFNGFGMRAQIDF